MHAKTYIAMPLTVFGKISMKTAWCLKCGNTRLDSVALVRERTIQTERPPPAAKLVPTFADRGVSRGQRNGSPRPL